MEFFRNLFKSKKPPEFFHSELSREDVRAAAKRSFERGIGQTDNIGLGRLVNLSRRKANLSLKDLSEKTGITREDLIDLESATLPLPEMVSLLQRVKEVIGLSDKKINEELFDATKKKK